jgi:VCBS repeat protein
MGNLPHLRAIVAIAIVMMVSAFPSSEGDAQVQNPLRPSLSVPKARFFHDNSTAFQEFLSRLPRRPPGSPSRAAAPATPPSFGGTWTALASAPLPANGGLCNPLLLTDATVIFENCGTSSWYKLTPDITGNYANGTWSQIGSLPSGYGPQYFSSAVLPDGRVIIMGGEYNSACGGGNTEVWTSLGAIYDPIADTWSSVAPPNGAGWQNTDACGTQHANGGIGDAASVVLPNLTYMQSACCANPPVDALLNAGTLAWTATGVPSNYQDEQGYTLMQNGKVLTIDVWDPPNAQAYDPSTGTWSAIAPAPVSLIDPVQCGNFEIGPAVARADGTVVAFGGNTGCTSSPADPTAIYTTSTNSWVQGPNVPSVCGSNGTTACNLADAPAALLPNGNVLFAASSGFGDAPTHFFEFSTANAINQVSDPVYFASTSGAFYYNFLVLPSGQILMTDFSSIPELYTPTGSPNLSWAPTITSVTQCVARGASYMVSGTQLNGLSQGAMYGDDVQGATNYPLVRIVNNTTGHVFYTRTSGHSTMSIAPNQIGSTNFKVSAATELGASKLYVVTNGIASTGVSVSVSSECPAIASHDFNGDGKSDIAWRNTNGDAAIWLMTVNTNGVTQILSAADYGIVPNSWQIVGQRDFNGDGMADLLWRNTDGDISIWLMNGTMVSSTPNLGTVDNGWSIVGTGDFNGDGYGDILWRNGNGDTSIWLMTGTATQVQVLSGTDLGFVPTGWSVAQTGDFNGDGNADILWHNTNGDTSIWLMTANGTQMRVLSATDLGGVPTSWNISGTGDFNRDGYTDILWRNANGDTSIWLMTWNGGQVQVMSTNDLGGVPTSWTVAVTGDFNGDGTSDIFWSNADGDTSIWFMKGGQVLSASDLGIVSPSWVVQGMGAD